MCVSELSCGISMEFILESVLERSLVQNPRSLSLIWLQLKIRLSRNIRHLCHPQDWKKVGNSGFYCMQNTACCHVHWRNESSLTFLQLIVSNKSSFTCSHTMTLFDGPGNKPFENTMGKGEIAHNEQFLLFPVFSTRLDNFLPFSSNLKLTVICKLFQFGRA